MVVKTIFVILSVFAIFSQSGSGVSAQSSTSAARTICIRNCGNSGGSSPQCANNGITYGSQCLFNCAKARNNRLRVVKGGSCARTTLNEYRGTSRTSSSRNSWFKK